MRTAGWPVGLTAKAIGLLVKDLHVVLRVAICDLILTLLCIMAALQPTVRHGSTHLLELSLVEALPAKYCSCCCPCFISKERDVIEEEAARTLVQSFA